MAYSPEVRLAVRGCYVFERLPLPLAASKHNISYSTAQDWKRKAFAEGDNWDKARTASRLAQGGLGDITQQLMEDFVILFNSAIDGLKEGDIDVLTRAQTIATLSDAYAKVMKYATKGAPEVSKFATAVEVLNELSEFISQEFPESREPFIKIIDAIQPRISEVFGSSKR